MTTTAPPSDPRMPTDPRGPGAPHRLLRRSRTDRVAAGVSGGLGQYFGVDPVLFRVLFATAAFFGGAGVLAYLVAWVAIPEEGTGRAPVDDWLARLRHRRVPVWLVAVGAAFLLWLVAFSWWAPHVLVPVAIALVVLAVALARQGRTDARAAMPPAPQPGAPTPPVWPVPDPATGPDAAATVPVDLTKPPAADGPAGPAWRQDANAWLRGARAARLVRRRRAAPVRIAIVVALLVTLGSLALADSVHGILLPVYFWVTLGIVGGGLLVGLVLRRTPWGLALLLPPTVLGLIALGGTRASLHDGFGQRVWTPTAAPSASYRLAFGQAVLDLRRLTASSTPTTIDITVAAGDVQVIAPRTANVVIDGHVTFGAITAGTGPAGPFPLRWGAGGTVLASGVGVDRTVGPPPGATGAQLTVDVHLADGRIAVRRTG